MDLDKDTTKSKIFVSYSRAQVSFADEVELDLSSRGHEVLIDRHSIAKGEEFQTRLGEIIFSCDTVVFILSDESAVSEICAWEVEEAARLAKRMLVVTLSELSAGVRPPSVLAGIDWIHCWSNPKVPGSSQTRGLIELHNALRTDASWLRERTRLLELATTWEERTDRSPDAESLFIRGSVLERAESWIFQKPVNETIPEIVEAFLAVSNDAQQKRKAAEIAILAEREAAVKRAEEAVANQTNAEKKRRDASMRWLAVAVILFAVGISTFLYATNRALESQALRSKLFAGEAARAARSGDHSRAMLLSLLGDPSAKDGTFERVLKTTNISSYHSLQSSIVQNKLDATFSSSDGQNRLMTLHPDGTRFLLGLNDGSAQLRTIGGSEPIQTFGGPRHRIEAFSFHPGGEIIVTASSDNIIKLWKIGHEEPLQSFKLKMEGENAWEDYIAAVDFHPNGDQVLIVGLNGSAMLKSISNTDSLQTVLVLGEHISTVAFHPDGKQFLAGGHEGVKLWQIGALEPLEEFYVDDIYTTTIVFHPDGEKFLTGSGDGSIKLWEIYGVSLGNPKPLQIYSAHKGALRSLRFHPDGEKFSSGFHDGTVNVWRLSAVKPVQTTQLHHDTGRLIALHPDGERYLTHSDGGEMRLWQIGGTKSIQSFSAHDAYVSSVAFHPDGERFIVIHGNGESSYWRIGKSEEIEPIVSSELNAAAFHPDGDHFVTAGYDGTVELRRIGDARPLQVFSGHEDEVTAVAIDPSGDWILSSGAYVNLWKIGESQPIQTNFWHSAWIGPVEFHPTEERYLSSGPERQTGLFRFGESEPLQVFDLYEFLQGGASFHSDGDHIITFYGHDKFHTWEISPLLKFNADDLVVAACTTLKNIGVPYLTDQDRQRIPILQDMTDSELDPCGHRKTQDFSH